MNGSASSGSVESKEENVKQIKFYVVVLSVLAILAGLAVSCGEGTAILEGGGEKDPAPATTVAASEPTGDRKAEKRETTEAAKTEPEKPEAKEVVTEPIRQKLEADAAVAVGADAQYEQGGDQYADVGQYEQEAEEQADVGQYELPSPAGEDQSGTATTDELPEPQEAAPTGTTMSLSVPSLGLAGVPVVDGHGEAALEAGTQHVPGTGFPWQEGSNTYIAGHRLGYPGTASDHVFYDLPNLAPGDPVVLTDENGKTYEYAVTEVMEVSPSDVWVTSPVAGRDVVTLQTCIEDFGDHWTEGPDWTARYVVRADRVA